MIVSKMNHKIKVKNKNEVVVKLKIITFFEQGYSFGFLKTFYHQPQNYGQLFCFWFEAFPSKSGYFSLITTYLSISISHGL